MIIGCDWHTGYTGGNVVTEGFWCHIEGDDIYEVLFLPAIPRKGDILRLGSLTRGASDISEVLVSRVEWGMEQESGQLSVWLKVRRMPNEPVRERP